MDFRIRHALITHGGITSNLAAFTPCRISINILLRVSSTRLNPFTSSLAIRLTIAYIFSLASVGIAYTMRSLSRAVAISTMLARHVLLLSQAIHKWVITLLFALSPDMSKARVGQSRFTRLRYHTSHHDQWLRKE